MMGLCSACDEDAACQTGVSSAGRKEVVESWGDGSETDEEGSVVSRTNPGQAAVVEAQQQTGASAAGQTWSLAAALKASSSSGDDGEGAAGASGEGYRANAVIMAGGVMLLLGLVLGVAVGRLQSGAAKQAGRKCEGGGSGAVGVVQQTILGPLHSTNCGEVVALVPVAASEAL
jgi:hypothetical protein